MFGELLIPTDAYYGIQTLRTCENLSFSGRFLSQYSVYIQSLALVKKAAVQANHETGELDARRAGLIEAACDQLIAGNHTKHFPVDVLHGGGGIGVNMNLNEVIANLSNISAGGKPGDYEPVDPIEHVNLSQSTSDVCHTAIRMALVSIWEGLKQELDKLYAQMKAKEAELGATITIARTCMQDGMAISYGDTFGGYAALVERRSTALAGAFHRLRQINLGATVVGSGHGASAAYREVIIKKLNLVTGENFELRSNLYDAAQNPDDLAEVSAQLALLAASLLKVAKDFRLLSSGPEAGLAELILPAVQAGSSFFPGKVNPVVAETLIQCCFQVLGCDRTVQAVVEHGELNLNVWEAVAGINILEAVEMLTKAICQFTELCLRGAMVNTERCKTYSESMVPRMVSLKEKYGYAAVSHGVKEAARQGIDLQTWLQQGGDLFGTSSSEMGKGMAGDN
ncbi:lyase family protein [Paenibacillus radicis (ex Xue et al. 2023)]|uniref:Lyase family protein n=1 Tax=Paenibacillus radicis (ex Xue et al. 2023) TaxID=2972489 RepID=A0ABT1YH07_9BACL|nr:lyase family protein [Paenibacillus radicis (ex Xue et al. 2023)]MCR8632477.1 lyase family protein [Paenibacillus radicis (ex Xue et al. 2023)]